MKEVLLNIVGSSILIKDKNQSNNFKGEKRIISYVDINENKEENSNLRGMYSAYNFVDNYLMKYLMSLMMIMMNLLSINLKRY